MKIKIVSIANKMPKWVEQGTQEFIKRMPRDCSVQFVDIALGKRGKNADISRLMKKESDLMLGKIAAQERVCALDVTGKSYTTSKLSQTLAGWQQSGQNLNILIGGPEGLHPDCRARADELWSLSDLTLPHPIVRIVVAEALYRAWSVTVGHPYHRE